jgi:predicted nuclease with TOPRIM domain
LERLRYSKEQLELEIKDLKDLEQDKSGLKKKLNEQAQEYQKLKDKLDRLTLDYQELKDSLGSSEGHAEEVKKERKRLAAKVSEL